MRRPGGSPVRLRGGYLVTVGVGVAGDHVLDNVGQFVASAFRCVLRLIGGVVDLVSRAVAASTRRRLMNR